MRSRINLMHLIAVGCLLAASPWVMRWSVSPAHAVAENPEYERGMDALDSRDWADAVRAFERVVDQRGPRSDGALYWKAYAQSRQGRHDRALATLQQLREKYPNSNWRKDAAALRDQIHRETQVRGSADGDRDDDDLELRLVALEGLIHADPQRALPILKKILEGNQPTELKEHALFVLLQSGAPEATGIVTRIAGDSSDRELQKEAIEQLAILGDAASLQALAGIYDTVKAEDVKAEVLEAFAMTGSTELLLRVARSETSTSLRGEAIESLGMMGAIAELEQLWARERSEELKEELLEAFAMAGHLGPVLQAARDDPSVEIREEAVELLGMMGARDQLWELFQHESSVQVRTSILEGFMMAGDTGRLLEVARSSDAELRLEAVEQLGFLGAGEALVELFRNEASTEVKEQILESLAISGHTGPLLEVARGDQPIAVRVAAIEAMGLQSDRRGHEELVALYGETQERQIKQAVIEALFMQGRTRALIDLARRERDPRMKAEIVEHLAMSGDGEATELMLEILDE